MGQSGLVAMLVAERSAGLAPEMNLRNQACIGNKACTEEEIHFDFNTQDVHHRQFEISGSTKKTNFSRAFHNKDHGLFFHLDKTNSNPLYGIGPVQTKILPYFFPP